MIKYLYIHLFYSKKRFIMIIAIIVLIGLMIGLTQTEEPVYQQLLYRNENTRYYHEMMGKMFSMISPFFVVLFVMDHDQSHLKPLLSYFGRLKITGYKIVFYSMVLFWLYAVFFMLYEIVPWVMTAYYTYDFQQLYYFGNLYLDGIMVMIFVLLFVRDKHKTLSILFAIFYMVYTMAAEDHPSLIWLVIWPVNVSYFSAFSLAYLYKVCYICLGFILIVLKMLDEAI